MFGSVWRLARGQGAARAWQRGGGACRRPQVPRRTFRGTPAPPARAGRGRGEWNWGSGWKCASTVAVTAVVAQLEPGETGEEGSGPGEQSGLSQQEREDLNKEADGKMFFGVLGQLLGANSEALVWSPQERLDRALSDLILPGVDAPAEKLKEVKRLLRMGANPTWQNPDGAVSAARYKSRHCDAG